MYKVNDFVLTNYCFYQTTTWHIAKIYSIDMKRDHGYIGTTSSSEAEVKHNSIEIYKYTRWNITPSFNLRPLDFENYRILFNILRSQKLLDQYLLDFKEYLKAEFLRKFGDPPITTLEEIALAKGHTPRVLYI